MILIGGGEIKEGGTAEIDSEIKQLAAPGSSLVFFSTAANDAEAYIETIQHVYRDYFDVVVATMDKGKSFSEHAIQQATVIYLGGGQTELLMSQFEAWNLVPHLVEAIKRGVLVVGMSAGAQALSKNYIREEHGAFDVRTGWGIIGSSLCVLVHATPDSFQRAKEIYLQKGLSGGLCGIGESAAILLQDVDLTSRKLGTGNIYTYT